MRRTALLALGLLAARPARACGACTDQEIRVWLPFAGPVMILCLLWAASVLVARRILARGGADVPRDASPFHAARRFLFVGLPICIALAFLLQGSILAPALVVGCVWLCYVAASTAKLWRQRGQAKAAAAPDTGGVDPAPEARAPTIALLPARAAKTALALNGIFLALAVVAVTASYVHARSTSRMIRLLSYPSSGTKKVLLPGLIAKGESAVPALIEASRRALDGESGLAKHWLLSGTLHCLGRIGGPGAEAFLEEVVRERLDFTDQEDVKWQKAACLAYAECAGARAVPLLKKIYEAHKDDAASDGRDAVLETLKKTGSEEAAAFVRDQEAVLEALRRAAPDKAGSVPREGDGNE